jgi:hypothetical protein
MESNDTNVLERPLAEEAAKKPKLTADLSAEIARAVDRLPGDQVRCKRVSANSYRCNWIAKDSTPAKGGTLLIDAYQIRDSKFLRATKVNGKLVIEDMTIKAAKMIF